MNFDVHLLMDLVIILILLFGIYQFRMPGSARKGNLIAAVALISSVIIIIIRNGIFHPQIIIAALLLGSAIGWAIAIRVNMTQIPAMVAFQHGAGGVTAFLVSFLELTRYSNPLTNVGKLSGFISLIIGAATFSSSLIASGKLANIVKQSPVVLPKHNWILISIVSLIILFSIYSFNAINSILTISVCFLILLSIILGIIFAIRIGGADMPVLISFLNATAGVAAAFCGVVIQNRLLIACGATVAASGSILTHVMCRAMNRNLMNVFVGFKAKLAYNWEKDLTGETQKEQEKTDTLNTEAIKSTDSFEKAINIILNASSIIFVPGYGMALSQAQFIANKLSRCLGKLGKQVRFAIHPVAGRMPGHMNVLLAEADVHYDKLFEMKNINSDFKNTDLAIIVGASDVVNPTALKAKGTPISGMPILNAHEAKNVIICNLDDKPGYSGVYNSLYKRDNAILLFGDANATLAKLYEKISGNND